MVKMDQISKPSKLHNVQKGSTLRSLSIRQYTIHLQEIIVNRYNHYQASVKEIRSARQMKTKTTLVTYCKGLLINMQKLVFEAYLPGVTS